MKNKFHILHFEDFFHPDAGYQVNTLSLAQAREGYKVTIVTSELLHIPRFLTDFFGVENIQERDSLFTHRTGVNIVRYPLFGFYSGRAIFKFGIFDLVKKLNPSVLFLHGNDTFMGIMFLLRLKLFDFPFVLDNHMLEMASKNKFNKIFRFFYRKIITPIILKNNIPVIRLVNSDYVDKCLGIPLNKTTLINFGTDLEHFCSNAVLRNIARQKYNILDDEFVILSVGKLDESKGGMFLAKSVKHKISVNNHKKITFLVVGNSTIDDYGSLVEAIFTESENRVIRLKTQSYLDLVTIYQASDLALFPKQCSMSFFEAQACMLPVLLEDNEINSQRVCANNGFLFAQDDTTDLRRMIVKLASYNDIQYNELKISSRKYIERKFNFSDIIKIYNTCILDAYKKYKANK
ncbi:MAG: glycosyltransferase family 4 protein [Sphingobacteriaceae bacterium]|nr:glycosyltransferase family 4 protein [Sphingobacteriaceae bacterium]